MGTTSSLKGKVQKLKVYLASIIGGYRGNNTTQVITTSFEFDIVQDKNFGKLVLFTPHKNPPATVTSPIKAYKQYTIQRAYRGDSFFWGLMPQAGDDILFEFNSPVKLHGYRLRSGNYEHPSDLLYNTSVEVRPTDAERLKGAFKVMDNGFVSVGTNMQCNLFIRTLDLTQDNLISSGEFNDLGIAEGKIDASQFGLIAAVRLVIKSSSKNWVIISEVKTKHACTLFFQLDQFNLSISFICLDSVLHKWGVKRCWAPR